MMPPAHVSAIPDDLGDIMAELDEILATPQADPEQFEDGGWRRESMGEREVGGQPVKRFRWRRGTRENRRTYTERGYVTFEQLSEEEKQRHERNRDKYTTRAARERAATEH